jgi:hypothetical protein
MLGYFSIVGLTLSEYFFEVICDEARIVLVAILFCPPTLFPSG